MPPAPSAPGQGGFLLSLVTESFAVRALLGSLAAVVLAALAVRGDVVRSSGARRLLVLAPVMAAAVAAVASVYDRAFLPQLWVTTAAATNAAADPLLELLGDLRVMSDHRQMDLLVLAYLTVVAILAMRRVTGLMAVRRLLGRARPPVGYGRLVPVVHRYAECMGVRQPRVVLLDDCPGGAFTVGARRPVVALDPRLLDTLDDGELEGLVAHELAHIRRRDALLGLVVGTVRDVAFFLPPLHLAARWLRREQEESADTLATGHTHRPAALASGILKVWDRSREVPGPRAVCAAVPLRRPVLAGIPSRLGAPAQGRVHRGGAKLVTGRVERLIARAPGVTPLRRGMEVALAALVLVAASAAALTLPGWIVEEHDAAMVAFGYLSAQPTTAVESPAFATFRELAAPEPARPLSASEQGARTEQARGACPCVESQAQLHAGVASTGPSTPTQMLWRRGSHRTWELDPLARGGGIRPARPLITLTDTGPHVGFFLVGPGS